MYQNIHFDRKTNTCHLWDDKAGYTNFTFRPYAFRKRQGGKYKSIFGDDLEKIYSFNPRDPSLFESDVPIDTRILIDAYEDSDEPSEGHRVLFLDIETSTEGGFANEDEADKEITALAIYDSLTKKYTAFILDRNGLIDDFDSPDKEIKSFRDEDSMLMHFLTKWEELQPTIVTGWNSDQFDMPYIYRRLKNVVGYNNAKRLSPIGVAYINDWNKKLTIAGITHLDYMKVYEKLNIKKEPSYSLNAIGKKQVGMEKINYRGNLDTLYKEDIKKYVEYNLNDVQIMVAIDQKLKFIELVRAICHKGHVPYECYDKSSRFIEGAILMYLRRNNQVANNKPVDGRAEYENQKNSDEEGFEGAYVKEPIPGRYDWVFDLDLTSMYPNIVISLNLSPETKVAVIDRIEYDEIYAQERRQELSDDWENLSDKAKNETSLQQYIEQKLYSYNARMFAQNKISKYYVGATFYTHEQMKELLQQSILSISSNGVLYQKDIPGVLPTILTKWFDERKEMRALAKKYAKAKDWEQYEFYEQRQKVQKVLLNSIYGVLGLAIFRFYDKDNASAVTITGQDIIKTTGKAINEYFKKALDKTDGNWLIYTDTDSVGPNSIIKIKDRPDLKIKDLFEELIETDCQYIEDIIGKKFIFPVNLQMPYYDEKTDEVKYGNVKYIEKHKTKKLTYRIKTKSGKSIDVTEDHSIMIVENGKIIEKKSKELNKNDKNDKIISLSNKMKHVIDEIESVECLGETDQEFFDVGMEDSPHTFFANDMLVHNSCFASALPIIKKNTPDIDLNDEKAMTEATLKVTTEVQTFVNKFYDKMAIRMFNIDNHHFDAKQEVIAKTSFWLSKKRYAQFIINVSGIDVKTMEVTNENRSEFVLDAVGNPIAKMEVKGIDVVKSSFPIYFRKFMEIFLQDILRKTPKEEIDVKVLALINDLPNASIIDIAKNTSVRFKSKDKKTDFNPSTRHNFKFIKGTTAQAKAALAYNDLLHHFGIEKMSHPIYHGSKIKWVYVKNNDLGVECVALKADGTDPDQVLDFVNKYVDKHMMYEQELKGKLEDFYTILKWAYPNETDATVNEFFG